MSDPAATAVLLQRFAERPRDVAAVKALLAGGADPDARFEGAPLLHAAVRAPYTKSDPLPQLELVQALLDAGADVNGRDGRGATTLVAAVTLNEGRAPADEACAAVIALLRSRGAIVAPDDTDAAFLVHSPFSHFRALIEGGARADGTRPRGDTPLHAAASSGRGAHVALLLEQGAAVNATDALGRTPLAAALEQRAQPWVKANRREPGFDEAIAALRRAGGVERVALPASGDPFAPLGLDLAALRALATPAAVGPSIASTVARREFSSVQALVDEVSDFGGERVAFYRLLATLFPRRDVRLAGSVDVRRPLFVNGDLVVEGDLRVVDAIAVTGSLVAGGVVSDAGNDSRVTVVGDVRCRGAFTSGDFAVGGALEASDVVLGYYNDFVLEAGVIRAVLAIEDDHATEAGVEAGLHFDLDTYSQGHGEGVGERVRALLVDEVFDAEGQLENGTLEERLARGERIYRWPALEAVTSPPERITRALLWLAQQLDAPAHAAPSVRAIAARELGVDAQALGVAIDWALSQPELQPYAGGTRHGPDVLREFLAAASPAS